MMVFNFLFKITIIALLIKAVLPLLRRRGIVKSAWLLALPTLLMTKA